MSQAESAISAKLRQCYETDFYSHFQASMSAYPITAIAATHPPAPGLLGVPPASSGTHQSLPPPPGPFFMPTHPGTVAVAARAAAGQSSGPTSTVSGSTTAQNQSNLSGSVLGSSLAAAVVAAHSAGSSAGHHGAQFSPYYPPFPITPVQGYFPNSYAMPPAAHHAYYGYGIPQPAQIQSVIVPAPGHGSHPTVATGSVLAQDVNIRETANVFIPNSVVGAIIGRGGQTIREMINQSNATIKVCTPRPYSGWNFFQFQTFFIF